MNYNFIMNATGFSYYFINIFVMIFLNDSQFNYVISRNRIFQFNLLFSTGAKRLILLVHEQKRVKDRLRYSEK